MPVVELAVTDCLKPSIASRVIPEQNIVGTIAEIIPNIARSSPQIRNSKA
jgi:hypothetical protein